MKENFPVVLTPNQSHRQAAAQFAPSGLVANASIQPRPQDMQFGFGHGALESEQQPVVEQSRVIQAVLVADERVGDAA